LTAAIEFADIEDNGFVIRKDYQFTKYNENLEKEWEKEIDKVYGLQALPNGITVGNKRLGIFFVQQKRNPSFAEIHVTRFDEKGNTVQTTFETDKQHDKVLHSFVNEKGLNLVTCAVKKREKKIIYSLITFATKDLKSSVSMIPLESTEYETENSSSVAIQQYNWTFLKELPDRVVYQKAYFKDIDKSKKKELVLKTVEVSSPGEIANLRTYSFQNREESKFSQARLELDEKTNELYVFGYMSTNVRNQYVDGLYVAKYNYATGNPIFNKQLPFSKIAELANSAEQKEKIHKSFDQIYPVSYFQPGSYFFDEQNHALRLFIFNDAKGIFKDKLSLNSVSFDANGEVTEMEGLAYKNHPIVFSDYRLTPLSVTPLSPRKQAPKTTPMDFINSFSGKSDPNFFFWKMMPRKAQNYDILVSVKERNAEIIAYKISKN